MTLHIVTDMVFHDKLKPVKVTDFRHLFFMTGSSYCFARKSTICLNSSVQEVETTVTSEKFSFIMYI